MYALRTDPIDRYTGPYERFLFSQELGRPFAFPVIRDTAPQLFTALLEGAGDPAADGDAQVRVPPLWMSGFTPTVTPLAFRTAPNPEDTALSAAVASLGAPRLRVNFPVDTASWPATYDPKGVPTFAEAPKPSAVIGIIDDAFPFAHRAFAGTTGTRVDAIWLQSARAPEVASAVPFGREFGSAEIDDLRMTYPVDEPALYRAAGAVDAHLPELGTGLVHAASHGSHIGGIAAGNDPMIGAPALPDDARVIAVQLPNTIAWDTSGFGKEAYMLSAIHYIFSRASLLAQHHGVSDELPLILNFSYGWSANRHDGQSAIERGIEELLVARRRKQPATAIVMPTGNNFANAMHARFDGSRFVEGVAEFQWRLSPDDRTSSYLEIWLPQDFDPDGWTVEVAPPPGSWLEAGHRIEISPDTSLTGGDPRRFAELEMAGMNIGQISADKHSGSRWRVLLALIPTAVSRSTSRRAPCGAWTLRLRQGHTPLSADDDIEVWVQRDDDPVALGTGGRQSHLSVKPTPTPAAPLDDPDTAIGPVTGFGCFNGIASAPSVTRVAGYDATHLRSSHYSGAVALPRKAGTLQTPKVSPALSAVSDQGSMQPGLPSIGVLSGSGARLVGTSAAAASASRLMVLDVIRGRAFFDGWKRLPPLHDAAAQVRAIARGGPMRAPAILSPGPPKR